MTADRLRTPVRKPRLADSIILTLLAAVLFRFPLEAAAQEIRIGVIQSWPDNTRLGSPTGIVLSAGIKPFKRVGLRLAYEGGQDRFDTFGSMCVGLIPPELVPGSEPELRREVATLQAVAVSAPVTVLVRKRMEVALVPTFRTSWFKSERTGSVSERELNADESMWGLGMGGEILYQPSVDLPMNLFLGAHVGFLGQTEYESILDGYSPLDEGFSLTHLQLGIAYRIRG